MEGDRNPATTKRKFSEDSVFSSDEDLPLLKRAKRLSSATNDRLFATTSKRKFSQVVCSDDELRQPKRLLVVSERSTNIDDIPKELLVEILCRLPCAKSILRCKSVSKTWNSITSDPSFIGRVLLLQRHNQTPVPGTIINPWGDEFLTTNLFARFARFMEEENLHVLATWNDLVLLSRHFLAEDVDGEYYYICNPRTMQSKDDLVRLPPIHPRSSSCNPAVGFICEPYYKEVEEDDQKGGKRKVIKIDAEYKFKVVRILDPELFYRLPCFEFKIQVFSNDIGEWRESLVPCPRGFNFCQLSCKVGFASNGMIYWTGGDGDLLGLGPLMVNNNSSTTTTTTTARYQFHVIELAEQTRPDAVYFRPAPSYHLQTSHCGRLQLVLLVANRGLIGASLYVWELEKQEQEQMAVQGGGELGQRHRKIYPIMERVQYTSMYYLSFDPNDLDTCFVSRTDDAKKRRTDYESDDDDDEEGEEEEEEEGEDDDDDDDGDEDDDNDYHVIDKCNIYTGEYSKMMDDYFYGRILQIMLPWWPTPAPTIRSCKAETSMSK